MWFLWCSCWLHICETSKNFIYVHSAYSSLNIISSFALKKLHCLSAWFVCLWMLYSLESYSQEWWQWILSESGINLPHDNTHASHSPLGLECEHWIQFTRVSVWGGWISTCHRRVLNSTSSMSCVPIDITEAMLNSSLVKAAPPLLHFHTLNFLIMHKLQWK